MIKALREDQIFTGAVITLFTIVTLAFLSLPPTATVTNVTRSTIVAKESYLSFIMFLPMGENIAGVPLFDSSYKVTTVSGEQVVVDRGVYESLGVGSQVVVKYWSKGWLEWKTCESI
jgi:hypothetical protein